jgi:hypothetical protein
VKSRLILVLTAVLAIALAFAPSALRTQYAAGATVRGISLPGLNHIQRRILSGFASFEDNLGVPALRLACLPRRLACARRRSAPMSWSIRTA